MKIKCLIIIICVILFISNVMEAKSNTDTTTLTSSPPAQIPYIFATKWGSEGKEDGQFKEPSGIAVNSHANVYVADTGNKRIQKFDSQGNFITKWGKDGEEEGNFTKPVNIKLDAKENVYVVNLEPNYIQKFNSNGEFITRWFIGKSSENVIRDFAIDFNGIFYIIWNIDLIFKYNLEGLPLKAISLDRPGFLESIAIDSTGHIYLACDTTGSVFIYGSTHFLMNEREALAYLCIQKFDTSFNLIKEWGSADEKEPFSGYYTEDGVDAIVELDIDSKDNIYVSERRNNRIQKFDSNGNFISKFGSKGSGDGEFNQPGDIAIDLDGNIYVLDIGNCRIQKFKPNSEFKSK